jgi:hypothetical protein
MTEVRRVSDCPYRLRRTSLQRGRKTISLHCKISNERCGLRGSDRLGSCSLYRKFIYRKFVLMPEDGERQGRDAARGRSMGGKATSTPRSSLEKINEGFDRWLKIEEGCKYAKDPKVAGIPALLPNCTHPRNREGVCKYYWCPLVGGNP